MAAQPQSSQAGPPTRVDELKEVVAVARAAIAQEFQISERLDAKARGQVTLAGQWFALVQAVLAVALNNSGVDHRWLLWVAACLAVLGGAAVAATMFRSWQVWRIRDDVDVAPHGLIEMKDEALRPNDDILGDLITHHASVLQNRRQKNRERGEHQKQAERLWFVAMGIPLLELCFALAAVLMP